MTRARRTLGAALASALLLVAHATNAQEHRVGGPPSTAQPGLKWTDEQLTHAAHHIRAGRKLTPKSWPHGAKVAVCLTFDVDNYALPLSRGNALPFNIAEGEYGVKTGLPRVLALLDKYKLPATFYTPAVAALLDPEVVQSIKKGPHEIGYHGWVHEFPTEVADPAEEERLLTQSLDVLEAQWGRRPVGNRSAGHVMSQSTVDILARSKMIYDSTLESTEEPFEILVDGKPSGIVELSSNWIIDDSPFVSSFGRMQSPRLLSKVFEDDFDQAYKEGTLFLVLMHPHYTGQRSRIKYLEELIKHMKSKPGVWFATAESVARYVKAQAHLGEAGGAQ